MFEKLDSNHILGPASRLQKGKGEQIFIEDMYHIRNCTKDYRSIISIYIDMIRKLRQGKKWSNDNYFNSLGKSLYSNSVYFYWKTLKKNKIPLVQNILNYILTINLMNLYADRLFSLMDQIIFKPLQCCSLFYFT